MIVHAFTIFHNLYTDRVYHPAPPTGNVQSKITMAGDVIPYYTVTALVPTLK